MDFFFFLIMKADLYSTSVFIKSVITFEISENWWSNQLSKILLSQLAGMTGFCWLFDGFCIKAG